MSDPERIPDRTDGGADALPPGERLAAARQAQGLGAADVARQLKLSVWQVEALEGGRYEQLPGPIFVRGFIRNYARWVKLDPDELLQAASGSLPKSDPRPEAPPSKDIPFPGEPRRLWPAFAAGLLAIVAFLVAYEFYWKGGEPGMAPPMAEAPPSKAPTTAPASMQTASSAAVSQPPVGNNAPDQPSIAVAAAAPATRDIVPVEAGAHPAPGGERPARPGERMVKLVFQEESWVEIRDRNGDVVFSKLNQPGTTQAVAGLPPLAIVVGNAQGVRMTYDDQPVDLVRHTKVDVARLTLE